MKSYDSFSAGERGSTVRVFRRTPAGSFYSVIGGRARKVEPEVRDRDAAIQWALRAAGDLVAGREAVVAGRATLGVIFDAYLAEKSPRKKSATSRKEDRRRAEMFKTYFGENRTPSEIAEWEWDSFIFARSSGGIDARGERRGEAGGEGCSRSLGAESGLPGPVNRVFKSPPHPGVRPRTIAADLLWLRGVFHWATRHRAATGRRLLAENPVLGYRLPEDPAPRRPVATAARYEATMEHAPRWGYLAEILPVVAWTGRRLSSVLALRFGDVIWTETESAPFGAIRWRGEADKQGREAVEPIPRPVRAVLDAIQASRPGHPAAWLFPARTDARKHVRADLAGVWLRKAEKAAKLPPLDGSLWHAYKRWRVSELIDAGFPLPAIGALVGNRNEANLLRSYAHGLERTKARIVSTEIREEAK